MTNLEIENAYMGTDLVDKIYLGDELIYPTTVYSAMPLTFDIISGGTVKWERYGGSSSDAAQIQYSKNGGEWVSITSNTGSSMPVISVNDGDIIEFKGSNNTYFKSGTSSRFSCGCLFKAYGNILSLVYGDNYQNYSELPSGSSISTVSNFKQLFKGVSGLTDASNIIMPNNTKSYCYYGMFEDCKNLEKAPELPALRLESASYQYMFANCSKLNYVKCLATNITASNCTANWLSVVANTGTFVKNPNMSSWTTGVSGIPNNWTVQDAVL